MLAISFPKALALGFSVFWFLGSRVKRVQGVKVSGSRDEDAWKWHTRIPSNPKPYMSYSLNSLKGGYRGDSIRDYYGII